MKAKPNLTLSKICHSWETCFLNIENNNLNIQPEYLFKTFKKKSWRELLPLIFNDIVDFPQRWTSFMDAICSCRAIHISWPEIIIKEENQYVSAFLNFCSFSSDSPFDKAFSNFPINALGAFEDTNLFVNQGVPMLPPYCYFDITEDVKNRATLLGYLEQLILSNFKGDSFSLQFEEIFSTPFKFFLFLKKFSNWNEVFLDLNFNLFSFNHLHLNRIEKTKYLGGGLSGQVVQYDEYAVKTFYWNRKAEFKREILTYGIIQNVVPTLTMVSFEINQHILVLHPVASRTYKNSSILPALQFYENLVDDLEKLHHLGLVHRDIRPDNLVYIPYDGCSERLVLIDWSSSVYENTTTCFEGTVRYASDDVLNVLTMGKNEINYTHQDDLCSLVKVFLGKILSVDDNLISLNKQDGISILARNVLNIWTTIKKDYFLVEYFLEAAKTRNYEKVKKFMRGFYHGLSLDMVFVFDMLKKFFDILFYY
jgi:hypothetical protein